MIKRICNNCGKETPKNESYIISNINRVYSDDILCLECKNKFDKDLKRLEEKNNKAYKDLIKRYGGRVDE